MYSRHSTTSKFKKIVLVLLAVLAILTGWHIGTAGVKASEAKTITCWALCKPGSYVEVRESPSKKGRHVGYLDPCDSFETDGTSKNGYIRAYVGDAGVGWVYCGFVSTEEPVPVFERYMCNSLSRVACRRWISGPRVANYGWIVNGSTVEVFYRTDEWSVTSRGYIKSEYLEADPE